MRLFLFYFFFFSFFMDPTQGHLMNCIRIISFSSKTMGPLHILLSSRAPKGGWWGAWERDCSRKNLIFIVDTTDLGVLVIQLSCKTSPYIGCTSYILPAKSTYAVLAGPTPAVRKMYFEISSTPCIGRHFTWDLYNKYPHLFVSSLYKLRGPGGGARVGYQGRGVG